MSNCVNVNFGDPFCLHPSGTMFNTAIQWAATNCLKRAFRIIRIDAIGFVCLSVTSHKHFSICSVRVFISMKTSVRLCHKTVTKLFEYWQTAGWEMLTPNNWCVNEYYSHQTNGKNYIQLSYLGINCVKNWIPTGISDFVI